MIAEGSDRVEPLLVRAIPKNIRGCGGQGIGAKASFGFQEKMVAATVSCLRHLAANVLGWGIRMSGGVRFSKQWILIQGQWSVLTTTLLDTTFPGSPPLASKTAAARNLLPRDGCLMINRGLVCRAVVLLS